MKAEQQFTDGLKRLTQTPFIVRPCVVNSYDSASKTVDVSPLDDGAYMLDVRIKAIAEYIGGLEIVPKTNTIVLVAIINNDTNQGVVIKTTGLDAASLTVDNEVNLTGSGANIKIGERVEINGTNRGGLVVGDDLASKLNELQTVVQNVLNAIQVVSAFTPGDGGATAFATLKAATASLITTAFNDADWTNNKVMHGE